MRGGFVRSLALVAACKATGFEEGVDMVRRKCVRLAILLAVFITIRLAAFAADPVKPADSAPRSADSPASPNATARPPESTAADYGHPRLRSPVELEAAINQALDKPAVMDYSEVPLRDVVDELKIRYGIEIQLDYKALGEAKIAGAKPITFSVKGIALRSGLRVMLEPIGLNYVIDHEIILIKTADKA